MTRKKQTELKLTNYDGVFGYTLSNIKRCWKKYYPRFRYWIGGQTVMQYKGDIFVYKHDLIRFLNGGPVMVGTNTMNWLQKVPRIFSKVLKTSQKACLELGLIERKEKAAPEKLNWEQRRLIEEFQEEGL